MSTTVASFNIGLYLEHLEEASFLYEQRLALLDNREISWLQIGEFEERLEAHIDALVVGGEPARRVCRERGLAGEPGELFVLICLACRYRNAQLLAEALRAIEFTDAAKVAALEEALKHELPPEWVVFCEQAFKRGDARLGPVLASVCAFRRLPVGGPVLAFVNSLPRDQLRGELVGALANLPSPGASPVLWSMLNHPDAGVRSAAFMGLLRAHDRNSVSSCQQLLTRESWPCVGVGLAGDEAAAASVGEAAAVTAEHAMALGTLGSVQAIPRLLQWMTKPELAESCALALQLITGADLMEQEFVPDPVRKDELLDSELEAWNTRGQLPQRPDGTPFGTTVTKLSCDPVKWQQWLSAHGSVFRAGMRYRRGHPATPRIVYAELAAERTPRRVRQLAYEELAIRYGCTVAFDTGMRVAEQVNALRAIAAWLAAEGNRFAPGRWYFGGRAD